MVKETFRMANVVVIDDDRKLGDLLKKYLENNNHSVTYFADPKRFLGQKVDRYDIAILDILMPVMDGFTVLKEIRKRSPVPVIMLTAKGDVYDRIVGLELGADDYVPKPFEPRELLARIDAVLRRTREGGARRESYEYDTFNLAAQSMKLLVKGQDVSVTGAEFELLRFFCDNPFIVLTRDVIMERTKSIAWESYDRSVDVLVSRLRKKLEDDPGDPKIIRTVWGEGYMFIARKKDGK
jgi:DNA-binding response OmpR family regulator